MNNAFIDFETYGEEDLPEVGSWKYSLDSQLDVLCMAWALNDGPINIWCPYEGHEMPYELFGAIDDGYIVNAWNVAFEYGIWENHCVPALDWPSIPKISWFDTAAKAAAHGLPLSLENCGNALALSDEHKKSPDGKALLRLLSVPQAKTNKRVHPHTARQSMHKLYAYCKQDVHTERHISNLLLDLKPHERDFWHIDQVINRRGIPVDLESTLKIRDRVIQQMAIMNQKLPALTGNLVTKVSQTQRIVSFCKMRGVNIDNCQAGTVDKVLDYVAAHPEKVTEKHKPAIQLLTYRKFFGKSATSKYDKILGCADPNNSRVHYTMVYHGAHTGRWAGRLIQPHNFFKPTIFKGADCDHFVDAVANRPIDCVEELYQPFIHAAASATRMMLAAPKGFIFFIGDYNAIEARIVFWLARDEAGLNYYYQKRDPYCEMATRIFGRTITKKDEKERFIGKGIVLGAGFGLGEEGFIRNMWEKWNTKIERRIAKDGIAAYRTTHFMVVKFWKVVEKYAIAAVLSPGKVLTFDRLSFLKPVDRDFLYVMLPSGRLLAYPFPKIEIRKTSWGEEKQTLTYKTFKNNMWVRTHTYGGKLTENLVQAIARDVMAFHITELEFNGHPISFTVHDELVAELPIETAPALHEQIDTLMMTPPSWADGLPILVESFLSTRYKK